MTTKAPELIQKLIERELLAVSDTRIRDHVKKLLIEPKAVVRDWDYGSDGEAYTCWTVLEEENSNVAVAYCQEGFGPTFPWGLVAVKGRMMSIGMDCAWFETFLQAYFESAASSIPIWKVFKLNTGSTRQALSEDLEWSAAWSKVERLRALCPNEHYVVDQDAHILGKT